MAIWVDCLGEYDAETTTYSALAGGAGSSPYTPTKSGILKELRVIFSSDAATSLQEHVQFKLTCTTFDPNTISVGASDTGIQTAPAFAVLGEKWIVNQKVQAGVPVTIEARNVTADTPVTMSCLIYGTFEG